MPPSPTEIDPGRLRLVASAAKREALSLASEWGTPLARIPPVVAEAFQSPFGEAARHAIGGWERDLNDLGNHLFRLSSACEATVDEEEQIAKVVAGGFPPPTRHQDAASAFVAWEHRSRQHRPFVPPAGGGGGFVAIVPERIRQAAQALLDARDELGASYRRLTVPLGDVGLEAPEELRWVAEDSERLAHELRRRADAYEAAEAQMRHSAATALSVSFAGLLAPLREPREAPRPSSRDRSRQGGSDARRVLDELRSSIFNIPDPDQARKILSRSAQHARNDPAYAAGLLRQLGPKGLAKLLDDGSLDPCDLSTVVARASTMEDNHHQPLFGPDFLDRALGKDRATAARRAAVLGACDCPEAPFHPAWTARLVEVLYRGPDTVPGQGDSRRWFRSVADNLIPQLDPTPPGLIKEAEDALEHIIAYASDHPLDPTGKLALAHLLAQPDTLKRVATRLAADSEGRRPEAPGFAVDGEAMRRVLADIAIDKTAGPVLNDAASRYASARLDQATGPFLADRAAREAQRALTEVGALLGALGSRSHDDTQINIDVAEVGTNAVKDVLEKLAGVTLDVVKGSLVASAVIEGGKTILFAIGGDDVARRQAERDLAKTQKGQKEREALQRRLDASLHHLAYVSLLADPSARAGLHLKLAPTDMPAELPGEPTDPTGGVDPLLGGFESVDEWRDQIFKDGNLVVPDPNADGLAWDAFVAWTQYVNPDLAAAADQMHATMHTALKDQVTLSHA